MKKVAHIGNPLTLIGVFAAVSEVMGTGMLPVMDAATQARFVWFLMLFPAGVVLLFFATLNWNAKVLYAPSDYRDERYFVGAITGRFARGDRDAEILKEYWKPGGKIDPQHEADLRKWMRDNGIDATSVSYFLRNQALESARRKAVEDLGLGN